MQLFGKEATDSQAGEVLIVCKLTCILLACNLANVIGIFQPRPHRGWRDILGDELSMQYFLHFDQ